MEEQSNNLRSYLKNSPIKGMEESSKMNFAKFIYEVELESANCGLWAKSSLPPV